MHMYICSNGLHMVDVLSTFQYSRIEIPTMLQPKNMVVPIKQQPGNNHETTVVLKWSFWVVTTMHGLGCNNHTPTSQHRVMNIYYYLLLCYSVQLFHFTIEKILINQQQ